MTAEEMTQAREQLLALRHEVFDEVRTATRDAAESLELQGVPDLGDLSAAESQREVLLNLSETQRRTLLDIDAALERIDDGSYGICLRCEEPIAPRRLAVRPFSRYCIDCKTDVEKFGE